MHLFSYFPSFLGEVVQNEPLFLLERTRRKREPELISFWVGVLVLQSKKNTEPPPPKKQPKKIFVVNLTAPDPSAK